MNPFLEVSPYEADGNEMIGKNPREISKAVLATLGHPKSLPKAIRAKCIDCSGGQQSEVRKCVATNCALWPFRMGRNPFHGRAK